MEATKQVGFRFTESLLRRVDAYAEKMSKEMPGLKFSRADAVRVLVERGLIEAGIEDKCRTNHSADTNG